MAAAYIRMFMVFTCFLVSLIQATDGTVTCKDFCEGSETGSISTCSGRLDSTNVCQGVGCRITYYRGVDVVERSCVVENDPLGVYLNACFMGIVDGITPWVTSCQCDNEDYCSASLPSVTCWNYCKGNGDPSGTCQTLHEEDTCTGLTCVKTSYPGSDVVFRHCLGLDSTIPLYASRCYEGLDTLGNTVDSCQCNNEDLCNNALGLKYSIPILLLTLSLLFWY